MKVLYADVTFTMYDGVGLPGMPEKQATGGGGGNLRVAVIRAGVEGTGFKLRPAD